MPTKQWPASEVSLLCVGTPSRRNGSLDLTYLGRVAADVGAALKHQSSYHVVVVRSTVLPCTTNERVIPLLEQESGKTYGDGFRVSVNPACAKVPRSRISASRR